MEVQTDSGLDCERNPAFYFGRKVIAFRELRINEQIRIPQVRLFDDTNQESLGIVSIQDARELAQQRELDLVEVAPQATPPVCRLMDYGRFKFEQLKRDKESKRDHNVIHVKEMKLRPKISEHDFQTKYGYVRNFLAEGNKVKLTIMFKGREMVHQEFGRKLLDRMAEELGDIAVMDRSPLVEGKNMTMIMNPLGKKAGREGERKPAGADRATAEAPRKESTSHAGAAPDAGTVPGEEPAAIHVPLDDLLENASVEVEEEADTATDNTAAAPGDSSNTDQGAKSPAKIRQATKSTARRT